MMSYKPKATLRVISWVVMLLSLIGWVSIGYAAQRVLIRFDAAGHVIVKHVRAPDKNSVGAMVRHNNLLRNAAGAKQGSRPNGAQVRWFDSTGQVIEEDVIRHPGVLHVPIAEAGDPAFGAARNDVRNEGLYLLSGPDAAIRVEVMLHGTAPITWSFDLP